MLLSNIIDQQNYNNAIGITSICSANKFVLKAAMLNAKSNGNNLLIEATSNQVDQFRGYTGMTPADFRNYVFSIADETGLLKDKIILGGDHLGPNVWQNETDDSAMSKAENQIEEYVSAEFRKIHLDTSFYLKGDEKNEGKPLNSEVITKRAAKLVAVDQTATAFTPTNETGFSALFEGNRSTYSGNFLGNGYYSYFWSSTKHFYANNAHFMSLEFSNVEVGFYASDGGYGFGIRCLQD